MVSIEDRKDDLRNAADNLVYDLELRIEELERKLSETDDDRTFYFEKCEDLEKRLMTAEEIIANKTDGKNK